MCVSRGPRDTSTEPGDLRVRWRHMSFARTSRAVAYDEAAEARHRALRDQFLLDPSVTFLNHGSYGACPRPVFERLPGAGSSSSSGSQSSSSAGACASCWPTARAALASLPRRRRRRGRLLPNVTTALNVVARSLPLRRGRRDPDHRPRVRRARADLDVRLPNDRRRACVVQPLPRPLGRPERRGRGDLGGRHAAHAGPLPQPHHLADRRRSCRSSR